MSDDLKRHQGPPQGRRKAAEAVLRAKILKLRAEDLTLEIIATRLGMSKSVVGRIGWGVKRGGADG